MPTTFVRISDGNETGFSLATQKAATTVKKKVEAAAQAGLWALMRRRGWDTRGISYVFEAPPTMVARWRRKAVDKIARSHGALSLGTGPEPCTTRAVRHLYLRRLPFEQDVMGDGSETAWAALSKLNGASTGPCTRPPRRRSRSWIAPAG